MKYYIEALNAEGEPILGNLDGQAVLRAIEPTRCIAWKRLFQPASATRPKWARVAKWQLVTIRGRVIAERINPYGALA